MSGMAKPDTQLRKFANTEALNEALAAEIAASLGHRLRAGRSASLVVAGGRSPVALFEQLSVMALDWSRVWVTRTDERWVRTSSSDSKKVHPLTAYGVKVISIGFFVDPDQAITRDRSRLIFHGHQSAETSLHSFLARRWRCHDLYRLQAVLKIANPLVQRLEFLLRRSQRRPLGFDQSLELLPQLFPSPGGDQVLRSQRQRGLPLHLDWLLLQVGFP